METTTKTQLKGFWELETCRTAHYTEYVLRCKTGVVVLRTKDGKATWGEEWGFLNEIAAAKKRVICKRLHRQGFSF